MWKKASRGNFWNKITDNEMSIKEKSLNKLNNLSEVTNG